MSNLEVPPPPPPIPLPIDDERYATILPLEYTDERIENTLLFFSGHWSDLAILLTDPIKFFKDQQKEWDKVQPGDTEWILRGPVTAILRPADDDPRGRAVIETIAEKSLLTKRELFDRLREEEIDPAAPAPVEPPSFEEIFHRTIRDGAFFAEFALCTSILTIHYWEPQPPKDEVARTDAEKASIYSGGLTRAVLGFMPNSAPYRMGTLHFDLEEKAPEGGGPPKSAWEDRADFIVECIQLQNRLSTRLETIEVRQGDAALKRADELIAIRKTPIEELPPGEDASAPQNRSALPKPKFHRSSKGRKPTIIVERLSDYGPGRRSLDEDPPQAPPPCRACCTCAAYGTHPHLGEWELGDLCVKCYTKCPPDVW